MKAETADTIFRELLRRSSADGLNYLREQLAALAWVMGGEVEK